MSWADAPTGAWHCLSPDQVMERLECDAELGLTPAEDGACLAAVGENAIPEGRRRFWTQDRDCQPEGTAKQAGRKEVVLEGLLFSPSR